MGEDLTHSVANAPASDFLLQVTGTTQLFSDASHLWAIVPQMRGLEISCLEPLASFCLLE